VIEDKRRVEGLRDTGCVSRENVEAAGRILAAVTERDVDVLLRLTDPGVEWRSFFAALLERGEYRGHDALRQYMRDLEDAFEVIRPEAVQMLDVGDLVVAVGRVCYRGRASGVETEEAAGWVFRFKDRKVVSWRAFREPERALAAVGLETEDRSD
jgi:ketosteroid isomerase-like protein